MLFHLIPDSNFRVAHMWPTWVLSAPGGLHVGPMNLAIRDTKPSVCNMSITSLARFTATGISIPSVHLIKYVSGTPMQASMYKNPRNIYIDNKQKH